MFIGHFAVGLGAKKFAPKVSLGTLFIASQFLDLLWPTLLLLNVEHVEIHPELENAKSLAFTDYPISHSLLMATFWAIVFGLLYWIFRKDKKASIVIAICVLSHWFLDLIVHFPDLPLYFGNSPMVGFGLWNSTIGTLIIEGGIFVVGTIIYLKTTQPKNKIGKIGFWVLILLLVAIHLSSISAPPPETVEVIAWSAQLQWIFIALAFWIDKNRVLRT